MRGDSDIGEVVFRLDKTYVCKECNASFPFMSDMIDHHEAAKYAGI
jgi:hypothetical protein